MRSTRIEAMSSYIKDHKTVTLDQLCAEFAVSKNTVRRDIMDILETGEFKKIYGGISFSPTPSLKPFSERHVKNQVLKQQIAARAASFVSNGDIIYIDSGTTTYYMIEYLKQHQNLTILTNNLEAIIKAVSYPNLKVVSLSGDLNHKTLSFLGIATAQFLKRYNINKAFMSATGVSVAGGASNSSPLEYDIKKTAVSRSKHTYLLADHSKFQATSLLTYSTFDSVDVLVTDKMPEPELQEHLYHTKTEIVLS